MCRFPNTTNACGRTRPAPRSTQAAAVSSELERDEQSSPRVHQAGRGRVLKHGFCRRRNRLPPSSEPKINELYQILLHGEADRDKETVARWQAGYDLAMGRVLAVKVRTESYNAMLAAAKRGLKPSDPRNNTWVLRPSGEISAGSNFVKLAEKAKMYS